MRRHRAVLWVAAAASVVVLLAALTLPGELIGSASFQSGVYYYQAGSQDVSAPYDAFYLHINCTGTDARTFTLEVNQSQSGGQPTTTIRTVTVSPGFPYTLEMPFQPPSSGAVLFQVFVFKGGQASPQGLLYQNEVTA